MSMERRPILAVVFDWGGTLMRELPEFDGPMAHWPRVEAVPGAAEVLRALYGSYAIVVATNAALSDEALVRKALARVGLDAYVSAAVTARDLGVSKPDPAFFRAALAGVGCRASEAVMVGDGYSTDIVGAKAAGWRAVWFNPGRAGCPLVHPVHDAEVHVLQDLPGVLSEPLLPDIPAALGILREHGVPENIVRHSLAVAAVAHWIALRLRRSGVKVDPLLVHRGGLLHDLDKLSSERPADHGTKAGELLRAWGWPALAAIAENHVLGARPTTWEEKVVHYADKIVEEDQVVGLVDRVTALRCRYVSSGDQIAEALPQLLALEEEIARAFGAGWDSLLAELRRVDIRPPEFAGDPASA